MSENIDICEAVSIDPIKVRLAKKDMLPQDDFELMASLFKAFGDSTRVKILYSLSRRELCVCDISAILEMSISAISHQLRLLRNINLVKRSKTGKIVYYSLKDNHVIELLNTAFEHISE